MGLLGFLEGFVVVAGSHGSLGAERGKLQCGKAGAQERARGPGVPLPSGTSSASFSCDLLSCNMWRVGLRKVFRRTTSVVWYRNLMEAAAEVQHVSVWRDPIPGGGSAPSPGAGGGKDRAGLVKVVGDYSETLT